MVLQTRSRMNAQPTTHKLIVTGDIKSLNRPGIGEHPTHLFKGCFDSCVSPPHWGTRGRRFKSCQPDPRKTRSGVIRKDGPFPIWPDGCYRVATQPSA